MGRESGACFRGEIAGSRIAMSNGQSRVPFRYAFRMKSNRLLHVRLQSYFHGERKGFERRAVRMTCIAMKSGLSFLTKHMR